jgi:hypothetical protein
VFPTIFQADIRETPEATSVDTPGQNNKIDIPKGKSLLVICMKEYRYYLLRIADQETLNRHGTSLLENNKGWAVISLDSMSRTTVTQVKDQFLQLNRTHLKINSSKIEFLIETNVPQVTYISSSGFFALFMLECFLRGGTLPWTKHSTQHSITEGNLRDILCQKYQTLTNEYGSQLRTFRIDTDGSVAVDISGKVHEQEDTSEPRLWPYGVQPRRTTNPTQTSNEANTQEKAPALQHKDLFDMSQITIGTYRDDNDGSNTMNTTTRENEVAWLLVKARASKSPTHPPNKDGNIITTPADAKNSDKQAEVTNETADGCPGILREVTQQAHLVLQNETKEAAPSAVVSNPEGTQQGYLGDGPAKPASSTKSVAKDSTESTPSGASTARYDREATSNMLLLKDTKEATPSAGSTNLYRQELPAQITVQNNADLADTRSTGTDAETSCYQDEFPRKPYDRSYFWFGCILFATTNERKEDMLQYMTRLFIPPTIRTKVLRCVNPKCKYVFESTASMLTHQSGFLSNGECGDPITSPNLFFTHGPIGFTLSPTIERLFKAMARDTKYRNVPKLDIINGTGLKLPTHKCEWQLLHCTKNKMEAVLSDEKNKETTILKTCVGEETETFAKPLDHIKRIYIEKLTWMCTTMVTGFSKSFIPKQAANERDEIYSKRVTKMLLSFDQMRSNFPFFLGALGFLKPPNLLPKKMAKEVVTAVWNNIKKLEHKIYINDLFDWVRNNYKEIAAMTAAEAEEDEDSSSDHSLLRRGPFV